MPLMLTTLIILSLLLSVAFFTLMERKLMSYTQTRKGPNKTSTMGIMQPIADAMKLLTKSPNILENTNNTAMFSTPPTMLLIYLMLPPIMPMNQSALDNQFNFITLMMVTSLMTHTMLIISWASNSAYSFIGCIRSVAQMISYEISLFLIIMAVLMMVNSTNMSSLQLHQYFTPFMLGLLLIFISWMITCLAETNRSPFDFAEGESELVSGFNVEFASNMFTLAFLAEYSGMVVLMYMTSIMFMNSGSIMFFMVPPMLTSLLLWIRSTLPRLRYDMLMHLNWKMILPLILYNMFIMLTYFTLNN